MFAINCFMVAALVALQSPPAESGGMPLDTRSENTTSQRTNPFAPSEKIRSLQPSDSEPDPVEPEEVATPEPMPPELSLKGLIVDRQGRSAGLLAVAGEVHFVREGTEIPSTAGIIRIEDVSERGLRVRLDSAGGVRFVAFPPLTNARGQADD